MSQLTFTGKLLGAQSCKGFNEVGQRTVLEQVCPRLPVLDTLCKLRHVMCPPSALNNSGTSFTGLSGLNEIIQEKHSA